MDGRSKLVHSIQFCGMMIPMKRIVLGDAVEIERGGSPRPIDSYLTDDEDGLNWIKIGDAPIDGNRITSVKQKIKRSGLLKTRQVHAGDLILSNSMSFGRPYLLEVDGCIHDGWLSIKNNKGVFDINYLLYLLSTESVKKQYKSLAGAGVVTNLNKELVQQVVVFAPPMNVQTKIADFFSVLDKKIALAERKNLKLNELKECLLNQIISTQDRPMVELGSLANIKDGARVPNEYWKSEGIPYIRAKDLNDGMANVELYLTHEKYEEYRSKTGAPVSGDLIFVTGGNIGLSMFKSDNSPLYVQGGAILTVKTSESKLLDGKFLHYYLQTNACKRYIETHSVGGTIKHFTVAPSLKLPIPLIPIDEQIKIASFFSKLDEKISFSKAKLDMLRRLKQALLQQMFV